jgi:hypothetical protein
MGIGSVVARARRSALLLSAKWHSVVERRILEREFTALVDFLRRSGCSFHECVELADNPVPRGVAFRYDVHLRDIPGCFSFIDLHRHHNIPATFFLFWDYSSIERARLGKFLELKNRISRPLDIGLHDSPADAYLVRTKFDGDRRAFQKWLQSPSAVEWFGKLSAAPDELARLNEAIFTEFKARVERTKEIFGPITTVASHGGELAQNLRSRLATLGPGAGVARSLFAKAWLTPERAAAAGLAPTVDRFGRHPPGWTELSCNGGEIANLANTLRRYILVKNSAVQLLLHPYTWAGARRDAELSHALFAPGPPTPMREGSQAGGRAPGLATSVSNPFFADLQRRWPSSPTLSGPVSQLCTATQFREADYRRVCTILLEKPRLHRKQWEFAYIVRCVEQAGLIGPAYKGLGFLRERERLPAVFASLGCEIVAAGPAADQPPDSSAGRRELDELYFPGLLERSILQRRVSCRTIEMNRMPADLRGFDFCWSSSVTSHLGNLQAGLRFMRESLDCLRPGGVAVHTFEFNLESSVDTVSEGTVVIYRESDLAGFAKAMRAQGYDVTLNFNPGSEAEDLIVDRDLDSDVHLKLYICDVLATSVGLCLRKTS